MKWDPRGQLLATCGVDGVCRIWKDMESVWTCVHTLVPPHEPVSLAWSPLVGKATRLFFQYIHVNLGTALLTNVHGHHANILLFHDTLLLLHSQKLFTSTCHILGVG